MANETRIPRAGAAGVVVGLSLVRAESQSQQPPTFRADTAAVYVDVSVRDRLRRVVADLQASDFTVLDNGVPQKVVEISYAKRPIDVTVALDVSGSVSGPLLDRLRQGVTELAGDLRNVDR
jgi:hypothetical protein